MKCKQRVNKNKIMFKIKRSMFTELINKKWNYMFLTVIAVLAVAAMATLISTRTISQAESKANNNENEQVITGRYTQYNETTMRFIN